VIRIVSLLLGCIYFYDCSAQSVDFIGIEQPSIHDTTLIFEHKKNISFTAKPYSTSEKSTLFFEKPVKFFDCTLKVFHSEDCFFRHLVFQESSIRSKLYLEPVSADSIFLNQCFLDDGARVLRGRTASLCLKNCTITSTSSFENLEAVNVDFDHSKFKGSATITNCSFTNSSFRWVDFQNAVSFEGTRFDGDVKFNGSNFTRPLSLNNGIIWGRLTFDSCIFNKSLSLSSLRTKTQTEISFVNTVLPDTLDLSNNPVLPHIINLTNVKLPVTNKRCAISLYNTDITNVLLDYRYFKIVFLPSGGRYLSKNEKEAIYVELLKNFKARGPSESYAQLDIEYQNFKNGLNIIPFLWNCHGYHKEWIFYWTILFLSCFTIITYFRVDKLTKFVYKLEHIPNLPSIKQINAAKSHLRPKYRRQRAWYSLAYTATLFFLLLLKVEKIRFKHWKYVLYILFVYTIGIVCIGYITNYILQK